MLGKKTSKQVKSAKGQWSLLIVLSLQSSGMPCSPQTPDLPQNLTGNKGRVRNVTNVHFTPEGI